MEKNKTDKTVEYEFRKLRLEYNNFIRDFSEEDINCVLHGDKSVAAFMVRKAMYNVDMIPVVNTVDRFNKESERFLSFVQLSMRYSNRDIDKIEEFEKKLIAIITMHKLLNGE